MIRYVTAGESHGPALFAIIEGVPAGLGIKVDTINKELARRQLGFGRGGRMQIETDTAQVLSGVRFGKALGSPITLKVDNRDWKNWLERMSVEEISGKAEVVTQPRPGHADLSGVLKTGQKDIRNILERSSARETAARVAAGAVAKLLLAEFGIQVVSHVISIGDVEANTEKLPLPDDLERIDRSPARSFDKEATGRMVELIEKIRSAKDTIGGVFEVLVYGCPPGLGGYASWEEKLDGNIARALMSIQAIKGVEIGEGFDVSAKPGSLAHDEIFYEKGRGYYRKTNRAGGIEGGMTNGEVVIARAAMKPIPTLMQPLKTVDIATKQSVDAVKERSDVCAVPAAAVIGEAVVAFEIAKALIGKFGGDAMEDTKAAYDRYLKRLEV
ncbi:MAG: chorismate synthase [Candidatus Aquicultor secundus]|uniref:Chorismate synthase n=1 Tax=Candidatus Aquicultor secundus TaxID=1973895 RepID=A0A2M7T693_9ACTN|nr:chorismate synthase [Candidatus Aquicultor secundus]OIO87707.1 MAG: chorismate synthase [Candidatus Aquicultor secundus]PIU27900.1 MAG: chorismate synthase [Candidatus Aquicultor secundus]PIW22409.1 MAG: chorismate synthase [Candidatus Aquicultor secundus]PIX53021.1 MAG: chorismate synthase [Candidatus Aquicultor secundus]PIY39581.1 MAG: chorismate synthase [Candidatus Aquicultor secundus]